MMKKYLVISVLATIVLIAVGGSLVYRSTHDTNRKYLAFVNEGWQTIKDNYWEIQTDEQLGNLYQLGLEKVTGLKPATISNVKQLNDTLRDTLRGKSDEEKQKLVTELTDLVLVNLKPFGRSRLYTQKQESDLSNLVKNISGQDRYRDLGISKDATNEQINATIDKKQEELKQSEISATSSAERQQIKQQKEELEQTAKILTDDKAKKVYDETGVEPTLDYTLISPRIFYLHLTKFSPTSLEEIQNTTAKYNKGDLLDTLILDLSDNIGGAIDGLPYFLGPFIGKDQFAYQFFRQGKYTDFKTLNGWLDSLVRYKRVVIIINENTQSTAEVMASVLKKYNVGLLVGKTSKGWGTVERVFPVQNQISLSDTYSIFLVHSVTLREDNQPIEGRGVEPVVDVSKEGWEKEFKRYYNDSELLEIVKEKTSK